MKIFIVGTYNTFITELIKKLHKENDKIYVLTGDKYHGSKPSQVFEQYLFPYASDSIIEILDSVQPDVIIFSGAYDSNFQWQNIRNESMHYISSLINIIMTAESQRIRQFIYLSSDAVYESSSDSLIQPDSPVTATDYKGFTIAQGEDLCRHFDQNTNLDICILRIDHLYKMPSDLSELTDNCSILCAEAIQTGSITVNENKSYSMLHVTDAVYGIYNFIHQIKHKTNCYHLSSSQPVSDIEIANHIKAVDNTISIKDNTIGNKQKVILDNTAFCEEFRFKTFQTYEKNIPAIYLKMKKHKKKYLPSSKKDSSHFHLWDRIKALFLKLLPYLENCIIFIPVFMINNRAVGSQYFDKLDFFLLYVLLFAGIYGTKQAVFSAALSVIGYCFRQLYSKTGIELLVDYNTYLWIAQLFIVAMAVGRLRDSSKTIFDEKNEEISFLNTQLTDMININESNNRIKNIYQNRIIDYDDSLVKIYSITSELDSMEAGAVLFYAADIISRILNTPDVAIYQVANGDYCRLFSATSSQAKSLGKSVKYSAMNKMMDSLNNNQVFINKTLDEEYPLMASAIYRSGKPIEIIMIWGLSFENMTIYQCNLLTVLGYMIYNSVERADRYLDALEHTRFIPNTKLLTPDAFEELHHTYQDAMEKGFTEYTVLTVHSNEKKTYKEWSQTLSSKLRLSDYVGIDKKGQISILLTNSSIQDAQFIIARFKEMNIQCLPLQ